jgi:hypothetical protein
MDEELTGTPTLSDEDMSTQMGTRRTGRTAMRPTAMTPTGPTRRTETTPTAPISSPAR